MKRVGAIDGARRPLRNERGGTIVIVALAMLMLLSAVAIAVDIGMLLTARTEAQRAADASALAGAGWLILNAGDEAGARAEAIDFGGRNDIQGDAVEVLSEDVEIDLGNGFVRVTARRLGDRGNPVSTWFARVFGIEDVDVTAVATAAIADASAANCMKPWIIPDGWLDLDLDGIYDTGEPYDPAVHGYGTVEGSTFRNDHFPENTGLDPHGTTYVEDVGRPIELKTGNPNEAIQPGWFFPWDIPQADGSPSVGGARYRWNIANCNPSLIEIGDAYMTENGNMIGPTKQGVQDLIDLDPGASWDHDTQSVVSEYPVSPRIVYMPLFDPTVTIDPGKTEVTITNMIGMFIEEMQGNTVIGRFLQVGGAGAAGSGSAAGLQFVRLVE